MAAACSKPLGRINGRIPYIYNYIYFHILMGNLPVIFKFSHVKPAMTASCDFLRFLSTRNTTWRRDVELSCSVTDRPRTPHNRSSARIITTMRFIFEAVETNLTRSFSKKGRHRRVSISAPSVNPCSSPAPPPLPPSSSRANWKTSVIILILAQIWWDQRWPAGCGRGADGCMLRGTRQRPFRF